MKQTFKKEIQYLPFLKGFSAYYGTDLPYTDDDIDRIEQDFGIVFPQCYRELCLLTGLYFYFPPHYRDDDGKMINDYEIALHRKLENDKNGRLKARSPIFVFQPNLFFKLDEGPNPPVYHYSSSAGITKHARSLAGFIEQEPWHQAFRHESTRDDNRFVEYDQSAILHRRAVLHQPPIYRILKYCRFLKAYDAVCLGTKQAVPKRTLNDSGVDNLEKKLGFKFPEAYRELYITLGEHRATQPLEMTNYDLSTFTKMQQHAREYFTEENLIFNDSMIVFSLFWDHLMMFFFRLDEGENPPVYYLSENNFHNRKGMHYIKVSDSFTLFIAKSLYGYRTHLDQYYTKPTGTRKPEH